MRRVLLCAAAGCAVLPLALAPTSTNWGRLPTRTELAGQLAAAANEPSLPRSLVPHLGAGQEGLRRDEYDGQRGCGQVAGDTTDITSEVPCTFGDRTARRSVLVVGDSQADMWIPTFDSWGSQYRWKVYRLVKLGCPPWPDLVTWSQCDAWRRFVVATILRLRPNVVVVTALPLQSSPRSIERSILAFATSIGSSGAKLLVLQNVPWWTRTGSPPQCLAATGLPGCNRYAPWRSLDQRTRRAIAMAAATGRVREVRIDSLFCSTASCPQVVGRFNVYVDELHFQEQWGRHIARAFGELFRP